MPQVNAGDYWMADGEMKMVHPPYSLDLAPGNFFLFPLIKDSLRGIRFQVNKGSEKSIGKLSDKITEGLEVPKDWKRPGVGIKNPPNKTQPQVGFLNFSFFKLFKSILYQLY